MAHFTLVISEVKPEDFEKLIDIQTKAVSQVKFIPQGNPGNAAPSHVGSQGMATNPQTGVASFVRFEWDDPGTGTAIKLLEALHKTP
ncbi:MAG: hypothetical protein ABSB82_07450 [Terriglobia bacterium]|jgi:hypothetical protein